MANKRSLKKTINIVCGELLTECVAASLYGQPVQKENAEALLCSIMKMEADFTSRLSHPEPGMDPKDYYKKVREQFAAQASEIADHIMVL